MKKISLLFMSMLVAFGMISCTSTSTMDSGSKKQAAINKSFEKVYNNYSNALVLDGAQVYEVKRGDTLTSITKAFYVGKDENGYYFPLIMLASHNVVSDPELITPGMKLTIPDFDKNIKDKAVAKKLSPYFKDLSGVYKEKDTPAAADILPHLLEISEQLANGETATTETAAEEEEAPKTPKTSTEPVAVPN